MSAATRTRTIVKCDTLSAYGRGARSPKEGFSSVDDDFRLEGDTSRGSWGPLWRGVYACEGAQRMKILCADHTDVEVPVARVFEFVTDVTRWPVWMPSVVNAQQPDSLPLAVDEELLVCMHAGRRRWQETFEVKRLVRN